MSQPSSDFVKMDITCYSAVHEKRFPRNCTLNQIANKLELLCGVTTDSMQLALYVNDGDVKSLSLAVDGESALGSLLPSSWERLRLDVKDPTEQVDQLSDLSKVEKFELTDEEYAQRNETLRAFKEQNKLGRFDQEGNQRKEEERLAKEKVEEAKSKSIKAGDRCQVRVTGNPTRRGCVKYVGTTKFKDGIWVGVQYDEPLGKNDGSVGGERYFECKSKYGGFVRPTDLEVGDFPEEMTDFDEM